jgi:hypothetical protein
MRHYWLSVCIALALAAGLVYPASQASAGPCAIGLNVHNNAWILLHHKRLSQCTSGPGCKCVSCYNLDGSVFSACYPLAAPIPH